MIRIGDVHFGCSDDRTEWKDEEEDEGFKYTAENVNAKIKQELEDSYIGDDYLQYEDEEEEETPI